MWWDHKQKRVPKTRSWNHWQQVGERHAGQTRGGFQDRGGYHAVAKLMARKRRAAGWRGNRKDRSWWAHLGPGLGEESQVPRVQTLRSSLALLKDCTPDVWLAPHPFPAWYPPGALCEVISKFASYWWLEIVLGLNAGLQGASHGQKKGCCRELGHKWPTFKFSCEFIQETWFQSQEQLLFLSWIIWVKGIFTSWCPFMFWRKKQGIYSNSSQDQG